MKRKTPVAAGKKTRKRIPDDVRRYILGQAKELEGVLSHVKFEVSDDLRVLPKQLQWLADGQPFRQAFAHPETTEQLPKHWERFCVYYRMRESDHKKGKLSPPQVRASNDKAVAAANAVGTGRKLTRYSYQKMLSNYPKPVVESELDDFDSGLNKPNALEAFQRKYSRRGRQ